MREHRQGKHEETGHYMSGYRWRVPQAPKYEYGEPPTALFAVVAFVVVLIAGFVLTVLTWKQGDPVFSGKFVLRSLGLPILAWGVACGCFYAVYEDWTARVDQWKHLSDDEFANWRVWARAHLCILNSLVLTPEVDLAERMLGLEGTPPSHAGQTLMLADASAVLDRTRQTDVLEKLLTPFAPFFERFGKTASFEIVIQSQHDEDLTELRELLGARYAKTFAGLRIERIDPDAQFERLEHWMTNQYASYSYYGRKETMSDFCLMLACHLHQSDDDRPHTEAAAAILFASGQAVENYKIKPKVRLFRPNHIDDTNHVLDALETFKTAAPTPMERLKHVWISGLSKRDGHAMRTALADVEPQLTTHDIDAAIGKPGPGNALLLQALAAQMVPFGQGPQLVVTPRADVIGGVTLNLIGGTKSEIRGPATPEFNPYPTFPSLAISCLFLLIVIALIMEKATPTAALSTIGIFVLVLLVALPVFVIVRNRNVTNDFYGTLRR
jgi:hypothetical protein